MPSSVVTSYEYNPRSKELYVKFISGNVYRYKEVPVQLYKQLQKALSKGKFFNMKIKGVFEFERVE